MIISAIIIRIMIIILRCIAMIITIMMVTAVVGTVPTMSLSWGGGVILPLIVIVRVSHSCHDDEGEKEEKQQ